VLGVFRAPCQGVVRTLRLYVEFDHDDDLPADLRG
jgi:hypothetical protein